MSVAEGSQSAEREQLDELLISKIENLRPKLLDLSRRNPLVSTPLSGRGNSYLRAVDELPDVLCFQLEQGASFRLCPLPPLDEDPADEQSETFLDALSEARHTDPIYAEQLSKVDPSDEEAAEAQRAAERELKDRIREEIGLASRQTKESLSLQQHAKNHHINPAYDVPTPDQEHDDGRHTDDAIQTLLLPEPLERSAGRLLQKTNTWMQETGLNVLHAAFGCLEWAPENETQKSFSPLILLPVKMERRKTPRGVEYRIVGTGEPAEMNNVLAEKLRLEHAVEFPKFEGGSIETYLEQVAEAAPRTMHWRIRRYVTIGVFPSARMAMYYDLETAAEKFTLSSPARTLLGGAPVEGGSSPFAEEYEIDTPHIEEKVPALVSDADSSQFSVLVDLADKKNLAVEGPPGTGKSQTIVNAIAAAMGEGKKVLFVAEKTAALNVVRSRLEALGFGEFLVSLQADRASREQVIQSLRDRLNLGSVTAPANHEKDRQSFRRSRDEIQHYIDALKSEFADTGLTVRDVLSKAIATSETFEQLPNNTRRPSIPNLREYDRSVIDELKDEATFLEKAWMEAREAEWYWRNCKLPNLDRFSLEALLEQTDDAASRYSELAANRNQLANFGLPEEAECAHLEQLRLNLEKLISADPRDFTILREAASSPRLNELQAAIDASDAVHSTRRALSEILRDPDAPGLSEDLSKLSAICAKQNFKSLDIAQVRASVDHSKEELKTLARLLEPTTRFLDSEPELSGYRLDTLRRARELASAVKPGVLALRAHIAHDVSHLSVLKSGADYAETLRADRDRLGEIFHLGQLPDAGKLSDAGQALQSAGFFARFGARFRDAKQLHRGLTKAGEKSFDAALAGSELIELSEWKRKADSFDADPALRAACSGRFFGLDTDFAALLDLFDFYQRVDEVFGGIENRSLRRFLKTADAEMLLEIPVCEVECRRPAGEIESEIADRTKVLEAQEEATSDIAQLASHLHDAKDLAPSQLAELADRVVAFTERRDELTHLPAAGWLQNALRDDEAGIEALRATREAAALAVECAPFTAEVLEIVESNRAEEAVAAVEAVLASEQAAQQALSDLIDETDIDADRFSSLPAREAAHALRSASRDHEGLVRHARLQEATLPFRQKGLGWLIEDLLTIDDGLEGLPRTVEAVIYRALSRAIYEEYGATLRRFSGHYLDDVREKVASRDRRQIGSASSYLRTGIANKARPPRGRNYGRVSEYTELGLIEHECTKKKRHASVRDLVSRAGRALQELKPCWMMSPLAVAQYIPKGSVSFDLCIIDEASQMPPENALGALMRADQVMIVGDTNQLPPTSFFQKLIQDEDADEDEAVLQESVLEMANGAFRPARRLRWHYRSRHSGLISFSNRLIYNDDLIVFPSASEDRVDQGVSLVQVNGLYKSGVNAEEARHMVDAAIRFMHEQPHRSLGLVTLNQKQRDLIMEELQHALDRDNKAARYVEHWREYKDGLEELFVKNLENVQGDERDVIFIGTVYGPEQPGARVHQRFGPINGLAGRRRLNVLFSRAKQQIVTFSSMTSADILAEENGNQGAFMLKCWLEYSATGRLERGQATGKDFDSDFEEFVAQQIEAMGYEAVPQVGVAGYFVDIGVKHPDWPHGFVLGVECDGAAYHSAKSARDRDRLRQEVLEGLGWKLHRIWSTDWFEDPRREGERLRGIIMDTLNDLKSRENEFLSPATEYEAPAEKTERPNETRNLEDGQGDEPETKVGAAESREQTSQTETRLPSSEQFDLALASKEKISVGADVGDSVRVRYLDGDEATLLVTLSDGANDPENGLININKPLGQALVGAEAGMKIEILAGYRMRSALVEAVSKPKAGSRPPE